jgi:hypothetical protein
VELVSYYKRHPLYRKIKLWYPVNEDLIRGISPVSDLHSYSAIMSCLSFETLRLIYIQFKFQVEMGCGFCPYHSFITHSLTSIYNANTLNVIYNHI